MTPGSVSQPSCILRPGHRQVLSPSESHGCSPCYPQPEVSRLERNNAVSEMTRRPRYKGAPPAQVHPQETNQGVAPCRVRLPRPWDIYTHRHSSICHREVGHPLSKPTCLAGSSSPDRTGREPSRSTGQPQKPRKTCAGPSAGGTAEPGRYQGRVAQLTHNAALASSGRRAPHRTRSTVLTPSRDEWVVGRGISRRTMALPHCSRCNKLSVLNPCRECATAKELDKYPADPREKP